MSNSRYHPLLPTPKEAEEVKTSFYSDHLPILTDVIIQNTPLKMISWNIHIPNMGSGFDVRETEEDEKAREDKIIQAIVLFITEQQPDIILLQEVFFTSEKLQNALNNVGWMIDTKRDSTIATLYNPKKLEKLDLPEEKQQAASYQPVALQTSLLKIKSSAAADNDTPVLIHNVHLQHEDFPHEAEEYITTSLQQGQKAHGNAIVAGDFNNRYVPVGKSFLPNNVVSARFREDIDMQGVDFTDGIFIMGEDGLCHQPPAKIHTLNPEDGQIYLIDISATQKQMSEKQQQELMRSRPMLSCAVEYATTPKEFTSKELHDLKEIGAFYGRVTNAYNSQKSVIHFPPKRTSLEHLIALDRCLPLLSSSNKSLADIAWQCFTTHIDCERAASAAANKKLSPTYENPIVRDLLLECKSIADQNNLESAARDVYFKAKILSFIDNPIAQTNALQFATLLIKSAPQLALSCFKQLNSGKLSAGNDALLMKRIIIARLTISMNDRHSELQNNSGFLNSLSRSRISKKINELQLLSEKIDKTDIDKALYMEFIANLSDKNKLKRELTQDIAELTKNLGQGCITSSVCLG